MDYDIDKYVFFTLFGLIPPGWTGPSGIVALCGVLNHT